MTRLHQMLLIGTFLPLCWLGMMAVHELGHVIGALATGGVISRVVLHPLAISRTDLAENPQPLVVAWSGPIVGVFVPLLALALVSQVKSRSTYLVRFFAGFCLIANGAYLGVGSFNGIGDAGDMLRQAAPIGWLWVFGGVTIPLGLVCWHGIGSKFGLGTRGDKVDPLLAYASCGLLALVVILEFAFSAR